MSKMGDSRFRELKARKGAKWKEKNRELWNGENISHEDTKARRENRVSVFMRLPPHTNTDSMYYLHFLHELHGKNGCSLWLCDFVREMVPQ